MARAAMAQRERKRDSESDNDSLPDPELMEKKVCYNTKKYNIVNINILEHVYNMSFINC